MQQKLGKWSLRFTEAPFILESSSVVGTKEADGPLGGLFDIVGKDDRFGPVSYTHLDVYKRQVFTPASLASWRTVGSFSPVFSSPLPIPFTIWFLSCTYIGVLLDMSSSIIM